MFTMLNFIKTLCFDKKNTTTTQEYFDLFGTKDSGYDHSGYLSYSDNEMIKKWWVKTDKTIGDIFSDNNKQR